MNELNIGRFKKITITLFVLDMVFTILLFAKIYFSGKDVNMTASNILIFLIPLIVIAGIAITLTVFRKKAFPNHNLELLDLIVPASALNYLLALVIIIVFFFE